MPTGMSESGDCDCAGTATVVENLWKATTEEESLEAILENRQTDRHIAVRAIKHWDSCYRDRHRGHAQNDGIIWRYTASLYHAVNTF